MILSFPRYIKKESTMLSSFTGENIERLTLNNDCYRLVHRTHKYSQVVFMSLNPDEYIPKEVHEKTDQFIRVEKGTATVKIYETSRDTDPKKIELYEDQFIVIEAGTYHRVENNERNKLKIYLVYCGEPEHTEGLVQKRQNGERFYREEQRNIYDY